MGDANGELSEAAPEISFGRRRRLPRTFEDFVRLERAAAVEQPLGLGEGLQRR